MILFLAASLGFQSVLAHAEVTTSDGEHYRVETCFRGPRDLQTRFAYPDRSMLFLVKGEAVTITENGKAPKAAGEREKSFALGHNFHAIHYNFDKLVSDRRSADASTGKEALRPGSTGALIYGGSATALYAPDGRAEGYRFDFPGTTPIELRFSDWRQGGVPFQLELNHAGLTYDYRFTKVEFRC